MLRVTLQNLLLSPSTFPQTRIKPADPDTIFTVMIELQRMSQETNQSETLLIYSISYCMLRKATDWSPKLSRYDTNLVI